MADPAEGTGHAELISHVPELMEWPEDRPPKERVRDDTAQLITMFADMSLYKKYPLDVDEWEERVPEWLEDGMTFYTQEPAKSYPNAYTMRRVKIHKLPNAGKGQMEWGLQIDNWEGNSWESEEDRNWGYRIHNIYDHDDNSRLVGEELVPNYRLAGFPGQPGLSEDITKDWDASLKDQPLILTNTGDRALRVKAVLQPNQKKDGTPLDPDLNRQEWTQSYMAFEILRFDGTGFEDADGNQLGGEDRWFWPYDKENPRYVFKFWVSDPSLMDEAMDPRKLVVDYGNGLKDERLPWLEYIVDQDDEEKDLPVLFTYGFSLEERDTNAYIYNKVAGHYAQKEIIDREEVVTRLEVDVTGKMTKTYRVKKFAMDTEIILTDPYPVWPIPSSVNGVLFLKCIGHNEVVMTFWNVLFNGKVVNVKTDGDFTDLTALRIDKATYERNEKEGKEKKKMEDWKDMMERRGATVVLAILAIMAIVYGVLSFLGKL